MSERERDKMSAREVGSEEGRGEGGKETEDIDSRKLMPVNGVVNCITEAQPVITL